MLSKVILTTVAVILMSSILLVTPLHASAFTIPKTSTTTKFTVPAVAMRCPDGSLAPNNSVSKCPPLVPTKSNNQSPQNPNYKAQATYVQNGGTSFAGVVGQQATQAHNTQNSQQASNAHQATQATQAYEPQNSKSNTQTKLQVTNTVKSTTPTLNTAPKNTVPTIKTTTKTPVPTVKTIPKTTPLKITTKTTTTIKVTPKTNTTKTTTKSTTTKKPY